MLQAYRRGFLKPDYPNGLQSRIREEMILLMLGREQDADYIDRQTLWSAVAAAPHLRASSVRQQLTRLDNVANYAVKRRYYSNAKYISPEELLTGEGKQMLKVLKDFKNSATYNLVRDKFNEILARTQKSVR